MAIATELIYRHILNNAGAEEMNKHNPYGDDAGTRVGPPNTPQRKQEKKSHSTDSGNEGAAGIHGTNDGGTSDRPGSEPLKERENEHTSGYGGAGGTPKRSSTPKRNPRP
jgi:hypothetical protein